MTEMARDQNVPEARLDRPEDGRSWAARIGGTHPDYGLERAFLKPEDGERGELVFRFAREGDYEVCDWAGDRRLYYRVRHDAEGRLAAEVVSQDAVRAAAQRRTEGALRELGKAADAARDEKFEVTREGRCSWRGERIARIVVETQPEPELGVVGSQKVTLREKEDDLEATEIHREAEDAYRIVRRARLREEREAKEAQAPKGVRKLTLAPPGGRGRKDEPAPDKDVADKAGVVEFLVRFEHRPLWLEPDHVRMIRERLLGEDGC